MVTEEDISRTRVNMQPLEALCTERFRHVPLKYGMTRLCTRAHFLARPCPCATCNWWPHPAPTSARDGLDPQQLALVVFILPSISAKTLLTLAVDITCNLALVVFFLYQLAQLLMCTRDLQPCCNHPLQLALVVFLPLPTRHLLMCTDTYT